MPNTKQRGNTELLNAYRDYLLSKVSKVRILGEPDERELKDVFVELSIVDQRAQQQHSEFLGMMDSAMRRRFNPFADADRNASPGLSERRDKEPKRRVKPDELLRRRTKAIVTGAPGCGKTTLLKYLALHAQEKEKRLTVWLELKAIDKLLFVEAEKAAAHDSNLILQELWLKHLKTQLLLSDAEIGLLRGHWQERFKANEIAVVLDGFDELQDEAIERSLNKCVSEFAYALHDNTLVISTRPYAQHKLGNERLQELEIEPLNQRQIEAFLNCYYPNDAATKSLLKTLRERLSFSELLHVPLLLGLILRLHRENRFTDERLKLYETILADLINELDRSKSVIRPFKINDDRLRLDFLKFLAFERLLRDPVDAEEQEASRIVFSYDLLKEKARTFLAQERLPHSSRDLADDVLATPLLREVGTDTFAFTHLTLQEYLSARAFAAFHKSNEFEGLKIFCRAYYNPTTVELEVLPMMLSATANADKLYAEIERCSESLTFANFRLQLRGLVYGARISNERFSKITDRVLEFIAERLPEESAYRVPVVRSLIGIKGRYAEIVMNRVASLLEANNSGVRLWAAEALGEIGNEKAIDVLLEALNDEDSFVRSRAIGALGMLGSDKAVDDLFKALSDEDYRKRQEIASALGKIGSDKAVEYLINTLSDKEREVRNSAAKALGNITENNLSRALEKSLASESDFVRRKAAQTIGYYLLEPRLLEELSHIAANDPVEEIRIAAAEAKEKFTRKIELLGHFSTKGTAQPLSDNESRELFLVGEAFKVVAEAGHIFRPVPNSDWGIDGEIEFKNERGEASGQRVYLQLKSGDSYLRTRKGDGKEIFTIKNPRHREYWQSQAYPVLLVIRDSGGKIRWMNVSEYLQCHRTNIQQIEFQGEPFTAESVKQMPAKFAP